MAFDWSMLANPLQDLGYGLTQGNNVSSALKAAGQRTADMAQPRAQAEIMQRQEQERLQAIQRTVDALRKMGPKYEQFAVGVESRAMDPGQALAQAFQYSQQERQRNSESWKRPANAQFIKDPQLRQAYLSGQMELADVLKTERDGAGGDVSYGVNPQYFRDPTTGKIIIGQLGNNGAMVPTSGIPTGYEPITPMDLAMQKAAGTALGKGGGNAALEIPAAKQLVDRVALQVADLKKDPGLDEKFGGFLGSPIPNQWLPTLPNTNRARVEARIDQLAGESFLAARQMLKGGGQITDFEGKRAEAAYARMSTAQSKKDFTDALDEFVTAVSDGVAKLEAQAEMGGLTPSEFQPVNSPVGAPPGVDPGLWQYMSPEERMLWQN